MTTEEKIREAIEKLIPDRAFGSAVNAYSNGFEDGANFVLKEWQEAERWRKVEEELPPEKNNDYYINVRRKRNPDKIETFLVWVGMPTKEILEGYGYAEWRLIN